MNFKQDISNNQVPLDIYQTWYTKDLPPGMMKSVIKLRKDNPSFRYHLYDDEDCKKFIKEEFGLKVYETYENLIPGAYKADLWRYCILFKKGGIYIDIKFHTNNFNLLELTDKNYYVKDRDGRWENNKIGIYNGFMVSVPKNLVLIECIGKIVSNVQNNYFGINSLYPTGPGLLGQFFKKTDEFDLIFSLDARHIQYKGKNILTMYENYRDEQSQTQICPHYSVLYNKKLIYKNAISAHKIDRKLLFDIILLKNVKTLIPTNIFQVHFEPTITKKIKDKSKKFQDLAPGFGYFLFTLFDCGEFIRKNFEFKIYTAYTKLKHIKNKIDLWKYCVLYKNGGIYIDINFNITKDFGIYLYVYKNFYLKDELINFIVPDIIITEKENPKLLNCINKIVSNIKELNYGYDWSEVSNSSLITSQFSQLELDNIEFKLINNKVYHDNCIIVDSIDDDYFKLKEENTYLWEIKKIY